ncbi:cutinase family protein [Mycolicibacterium arenosum]
MGRFLLSLTMAIAGLWLATPIASADDCPNVDVVFARGTFEPAGPGATGQAFIDALQARLGDKTVNSAPVDYPASLDFPRAVDGVANASSQIRDIVSRCPNTRIVLGGYSQGAAVAAYTTANAVPAGYALPSDISGPMAPETAKHVAAVVLFAKPTNGFVNFLDRTAPPIEIGPAYAPKTLEICVPEDPVCSPTGGDHKAHGSYVSNGSIDQAADFVASKV